MHCVYSSWYYKFTTALCKILLFMENNVANYANNITLLEIKEGIKTDKKESFNKHIYHYDGKQVKR